MLACPDFVIFKGFKIRADMLRIRFKPTSNADTILFCPKKLLNGLECYSKQKIISQREKASKGNTKEKMLQDMQISVARNETLTNNE